jgi:hypothetical protein
VVVVLAIAAADLAAAARHQNGARAHLPRGIYGGLSQLGAVLKSTLLRRISSQMRQIAKKSI